MNSYSQTLKSYEKMDRATQHTALSFAQYLVSQPYTAFNRKCNEEDFNKYIKEKTKEVEYLENKLKIKL